MRDFWKSAKHLVALVTLLGGGSLSVLLPALGAPPQGPLGGVDPALRDASPQATRQAVTQAASQEAASLAAPDAPVRTGRTRPLISVDPVVRQFIAQAARQAGSQAASQAPAATPSCARCHESQLVARNAGSHKAIACETCHGPQTGHIASDGKEKPAKPAVIPLCLNCHEKDPTKPVGRPQVDKAEHYNGTTCSDCHLPHAPKM
jgi:hypothetical protein